MKPFLFFHYYYFQGQTFGDLLRDWFARKKSPTILAICKRPKHQVRKNTHGGRIFWTGGLNPFFFMHVPEILQVTIFKWAKVTYPFPETTPPSETKEDRSIFPTGCYTALHLRYKWFVSVVKALRHFFWAATALMHWLSLSFYHNAQTKMDSRITFCEYH